MRKLILVSTSIATMVSWSAGDPEACSTFCLDTGDGPVFGKNYDWDVSVGLVVVNKRDVVKTGLTFENPARWTSRYGSVTFNQYGREMPCGGINEAGLVIELMWLEETTYPPVDARPSVQNLQWIQYHLDRSSTVAEVIAGDADVRISGDDLALVHFLVADRTGACAAIEFLGGQMTAHTGDAMPIAALTNDTYERSLAYLETHEGFGGSDPVPWSRRSLDRFVRAATGVKEYETRAAADAVDYAFGVLAELAQGPYTQWSIVYDMGALRVSFRTLDNPDIRAIELGCIDFSCASPTLVLDMAADVRGDVTEVLGPYTREANRALVETAFRQTSFLQETPAEILDFLVRYPETTPCNR
jgi:penicillin V acylase-like amidase (Ntn superfamily)